MSNTRTIRMILGILAMTLLLPLAMPDSAFALPKSRDIEEINSVKPTCKDLYKTIGELEEKEEKGTITDEERGELKDAKELHDIALCDIVARDVAGGGSEDDDCTWKNLWCMVPPLFEDAQTEASPGPGPTDPRPEPLPPLDPRPEPLPPLDPRPEPPDPLPPAPVPLKEKTDQEKLEDQGYKCGKAGVDSVICTKTVDGVTTTRTCDLAGRCTSIKIIDPNPNKLPPKHDWKAKPVTGAPAQTQDLESQSLDPESQQYNKENVASPSEVLGAISSSDPDSSGEDTETSVDSSVGQQSEGSTTEAVR